jgi:1,4-alpha-glucan branching enzyme
MRSTLVLAVCLVLVAGCVIVSKSEKKIVHYEIPMEDGPVAVEGGMLFRFEAPDADEVNLAGSFNDWGGTVYGGFDPSIDPMVRGEGGIWKIVLPLQPGVYEYKFVINGGEVWSEDPHNPESVDDGYGGFNSVLEIE